MLLKQGEAKRKEKLLTDCGKPFVVILHEIFQYNPLFNNNPILNTPPFQGFSAAKPWGLLTFLGFLVKKRQNFIFKKWD